MIPDLAVTGTLSVIGIFGAWLDVRHRRLPNWLVSIVAVCGLMIAALNSFPLEFVGHLAHGALALIVGMILFRFGMVGGGDAKFYAALALWFRLGEAWRLLGCVSLAGAAFFIIWFAWRRLRGKPISRIGEGVEGKFPYGVAIAAGAVVATLAF